tara:strand:- start:405 stop:857 length:453 start_codon:yes stop_codon:yes gene_type:complete
MSITKTVQGNLLTSDETIIGHGCNCLGVMGGGIALQIKERYPENFKMYKTYCRDEGFSGPDLLGDYVTWNNDKLKIVNMFTQFDTSYSKARNASYDAIADCFAKIELDNSIPHIAIPLIGGGLGGGYWPVIEKIINRYAPTTSITLYELK